MTWETEVRHAPLLRGYGARESAYQWAAWAREEQVTGLGFGVRVCEMIMVLKFTIREGKEEMEGFQRWCIHICFVFTGHGPHA